MYAIARLGDNILVVAFAVLATYLLWPKRESDRLADVTDEVNYMINQWDSLIGYCENGVVETEAA
jgi:hypothetical protein